MGTKDTPPEGQIEYTLRVQRDDNEVRGNALVSGDDKLDRETEDAILARLADGDVWAWAYVTVTATLDGFTGTDHLGGCSYENEAAFRACQYYTDMCDVARDRLEAAGRRALHVAARPSHVTVEIPDVHLGGTSLDLLVELSDDARKALRDAIGAVESAEPHARDYLKPDGYSIARDEHVARLTRLRAVLGELDQIGAGIAEQRRRT